MPHLQQVPPAGFKRCANFENVLTSLGRVQFRGLGYRLGPGQSGFGGRHFALLSLKFLNFKSYQTAKLLIPSPPRPVRFLIERGTDLLVSPLAGSAQPEGQTHRYNDFGCHS